MFSKRTVSIILQSYEKKILHNTVRTINDVTEEAPKETIENKIDFLLMLIIDKIWGGKGVFMGSSSVTSLTGLKDISTPDFSTPSFNPRLFNHALFNHEFLNHGIEKSGVEMSSL